MNKTTNLIIGSSVLIAGMISVAWANGVSALPSTETAADPTLLVLNDYSDFLADLRNTQTQMTADAAMNWIAQIDASIANSENQHARQSGYVAMFSMYNYLEDWVNAESVCQIALQDAPDSATELERLGDLFAIQSAAAQTVGRLAEADEGANARWNTFTRLQKAEAVHVKEHGVRAMDTNSYGLYRWAMEERVRYLQDVGLKIEAAELTDLLLEDLGSAERKEIQPVGIHVIRHHRAVSAAMKIDSRNIEGAVQSLKKGKAYQTGFKDAVLAYGLSDQTHYKSLHRFVMDLPFDGADQAAELEIAYLHAMNSLEHLRVMSDGVLLENHVAASDVDVYEAFLLLEQTLSPVLQRLPGVAAHLQKSSPDIQKQKGLSQSALELLVDYLTIEDQGDIADQYIQLGHQKFVSFKK